MKSFFTLTFLATTALALPNPFTFLPRQVTTTCATGVHIIVARGSTEPQGEGQTASLSTLIKNAIPGSDSYALVYPALLSPYQESEGNGTIALLQTIQDYAESCPQTKIVLLGWSQGGQVSLDTLCGTSEEGFAVTAPLAKEYEDKIAAVVAYGDPSRAPAQPYNAGNATDDLASLFPRQDTAACAPYYSKIKSYCDIGDPFCASGGNLSVHLEYFDKYNDDAAKFVVDTVDLALHY